MAKDTDLRIIQAALSAFNEIGYFRVTLQQIADKANMSVGNMTYHFPTKATLLTILFEQWKEQAQLLLQDLYLTPIFENFNNFLQINFDLQQQYQFIYFDQFDLIRSHATINDQFQKYFQNQQNQLEVLVNLYRARGVLQAAEEEIPYIALRIRRAMGSWLCIQFMEGKDYTSAASFQSDIWVELKSYFTDTGFAEYQAIQIIEQNK